jgi:3-(methylthio)propionyl---CoA ligase
VHFDIQEGDMQGLMQRQPLLISNIIRHAARHYGKRDIASKQIDGTIHQTTWSEVEVRSRRLGRVLQRLGIVLGDRLGSLACVGVQECARQVPLEPTRGGA